MFTSYRWTELLSIHGLVVSLAVGLLVASSSSWVVAQEDATPGADALDAPTTESKYFDLRRSKDRLTQQFAERYFNLVKLQEWSSDKGTKIKAKYVSHEADLKSVTLTVVKGYGAERTEKEVSVPVARLSKTCQSRVKQIATIQKKLDELVASGATAGEPGQASPSEYPGGDPGTPMLDERGAEPRQDRAPPPRAPTSPDREERGSQPSAVAESSTADDGDPDPLGFGEIPSSAFQAGAADSASDGPPRASAPVPVDPAAARDGDFQSQWTTNYDAFHANFTVTTDEAGQKRVDFGEMHVLGEMSKVAPDQQQPTVEQPAVVLRVEVEWEAAFKGIQQATESPALVELELQPLPEPLRLDVRIDEKNDGTRENDWADFAPGDRVKFKGRLHMESPTVVVLAVSKPERADAPAGNADRDEQRR